RLFDGVEMVSLPLPLVCVVLCGVLSAVAVFAEDRPIYSTVNKEKPEQYVENVEGVMSMSEDEMLSFMPDRPVICFCACPNCYGGAGGKGVFEWSIEDPDRIKCRYCGETFPNEAYPEDHVMEGENAVGETVTYHYYYNEEKDMRHFLSDHLAKHRRGWLVGQCQALGRAYQATGDEKYARRVALALDKLARLYPHWPALHNRNIKRIRFCESQEPPYSWDAGRWGYFHNEISKGLVRAYDLIYDSDVFESLSEERGYDVRERIEEDYFREIYRAVELSPYHVSNVVGYDVTSAAMLGRVLGDPEMVHRAFGWIQDNVTSGFFYDGCWHESPSYHYMTLGGLRSAFSVVEGYSDPEGYVDEVDGTHIENLDPKTHVPFWAKVQDAFKAIAFPNGCSTPVHDTWAHQRRSQPRMETVSTIVPGYGHASLGRGRGAHQMQAQLHFSGSYGHAHRDNLALTLFAKEREMLSDIGYTWTKIRWWTVSTISHNLVAVDRQEQSGRPSDGDLLWFFPAVPAPHTSGSIAVVAADGKRGYANIDDLDMYRRLMVMIPVSEENAYVVDIFSTRGGSVHDWLMHGSADEDMTAECSIPLAEGNGEFGGDDPPQGYDVCRNIRQGHADEPFNVSFRYADEPDRGVRLHMLAGDGTDVYLGEVPSVRRAGQGYNGQDSEVLDYWMPQVCARRSGEAALHSVFTAVEEPFYGRPFVDDVKHLQVTPADDNCTALQVTCGDITDTIISTLDEEPFTARTAGDAVLNGRLGIVRRVEGRVTAMWLFQGRELTCGDYRIATETSTYEGVIEEATRRADGDEYDAFITPADLPADTALHGAYIILTHPGGYTHGYQIDRVDEVDGKTRIILTDEHGLNIDGEKTEELFFPQRTFEGQNQFTIPIAASITRTE
ncbi:MAG: heparinase II/III family protein, partial [Armatimonadota bacterium]